MGETQLHLVDRIGSILDEVMSLDGDELESLVQLMHECHYSRMDDPPELCGISRQAMRMLWMFRRHLESVPQIRCERDRELAA